jgi:NAD(P)-dependent dehydrogenase (short-subunit alcohol dehydrogenase family)
MEAGEVGRTEAKKRGVVVITGSGSIGIACARRFPDDVIVLADVSGDRLDAAVGELSVDGIRPVACDVSDRNATDRLAETAASLGRLHALVNTAGVSGTLSTRDLIFAVNLGGTLNVLESFEPHVSEGTVGICIASIGGHQEFTYKLDALLDAADPLPRLREAGAFDVSNGAAYAITKRGVILQCQRRARMWGNRGGRLVSVSPGLMEDTPMGAASLERGPGRPYAEWSALGRNGRAEELAAVVAFLSSDDASFISGCDILVDGGLVAGINQHLSIEERERWHACAFSSHQGAAVQAPGLS